MDSDIALYTLEQIINQEMTCVTTDRTQYKGVLLHMYRNLDCMLGNTEVKYLDKRIEQRETVFIRGTKIIFFILPESALAIISARVEEELAKETIKGRKSSKGKGKSKDKNPPKTSNETKKHQLQTNQEFISDRHGPPNTFPGHQKHEKEQQFPKQTVVPDKSTQRIDTSFTFNKSQQLNATSWQPVSVYQPYQQQSQLMYGYSAVPTSEPYVQQYEYPYQSSQMAPTMFAPTTVQPHPTQQPQNYQMQQPSYLSGSTVYYLPQHQPAYFMSQQAHQIQQPSNVVYQQPYLPPMQEQQHSRSDFRVYVQVPPYQVQETQYPHPNAQMQQQIQHPSLTAPVQTYQSTRSLPTQQSQHSNPNQAYAPTRSFRRNHP